jgi:predicted RNase H-like nuclease (RuvC/YqgF family)
VQLKSKALINKILQENLFSKEKEIEQLQGEVASLVRSGELLQSEIQRMQDEISCLTYKNKDVEIQVCFSLPPNSKWVLCLECSSYHLRYLGRFFW